MDVRAPSVRLAVTDGEIERWAQLLDCAHHLRMEL
jgi:hypothetical protein